MLALNSLIGSGWLFGSGSAAKIAGPAAIILWILGAVIIIAIALTYVELGSMFPESGGMSRYAQYSHGPLLGFIAAWANWTKQFIKNGDITFEGIGVVFIFMIIFTMINFWSVKIMTHFTNLISIFKILLPTLTIVVVFMHKILAPIFMNLCHMERAQFLKQLQFLVLSCPMMPFKQ